MRAIGPIKAVAGEDVIMNCPFAGYPIEHIRWEKAHHELTISKNTEINDSNNDLLFLKS